jgi:hypothetical protein
MAQGVSILSTVSQFAVVMLVAAAVLIIAAEWPAFGRRFGANGRRARDRQRRKDGLKVVKGAPRGGYPDDESFHDDHDDFVRAVERDLAALPTIDDRD